MRKTAESCLPGHPDKMCDQIADALVDECLRRDPSSRTNFSVLGSHGMLVIAGEWDSAADFDMAALARSVYADIGYGDELEVFVNVDKPSEERRGLSGPSGAVVVNGYATRETREMLPRPLAYAHALARRLDDARRFDPSFSWLRPDGCVQVSMEKDAMRAVTVLASHAPEVAPNDVRLAILERVVAPVAGSTENMHVHVNPAGAFTHAGFHSASGMNGQRLGADAYGGLVPFCDRALSGKDPRAAERAGADAARAAARFLVEQGLVSSAIVTLVYTAGRAEPISVEALGAADKARGTTVRLGELVRRNFDFRPDAIVERWRLDRPIYRATAAYGHFGRAEFPWEAPFGT